MLLLLASAAGAQDPGPRPIVLSERVAAWSFDDGTDGWRAVNDCVLTASEGELAVQSTGGDPYLHGPPLAVPGSVLVRLSLRCRTAGPGQVFWVEEGAPRFAEERSARFELKHDGELHHHEVFLETRGVITRIRLDPGVAPGAVSLQSVEVLRAERHPLEVSELQVGASAASALLRNHAARPLRVAGNGRFLELPPGAAQRMSLALPAIEQPVRPFEMLRMQFSAEGLPSVERQVCRVQEAPEVEWVTLRHTDTRVRVARDGSGAWILRGEERVAVVAPLVKVGGSIPRLELVALPDASGGPLHFAGEGVSASLTLKGRELEVELEADREFEGPVVRALGALDQGLFNGLEYLGRGEVSSSSLDVETDERYRFAPDPRAVTWPLMAAVTERGSVAVVWDDPGLQPLFASPNVIDGAPDHRMALRGTAVTAVVRVGEGDLDEVIEWAALRRGLPPLPPDRGTEAQGALALAALEGPLRGEGGFGHCVEPRWERHPYADFASTLFRLTGELPDLPDLISAGSHVRNDAAWFLTGRAEIWLAARRRQARELAAEIGEDGLFHYDGPYARGHFEDTASGFVAGRAVYLLEYALLTGDVEATRAGLQVLAALRRFRTPRGAQTWEVPLHTPDLLASASAVWACMLGYELTGDREHLDQAKRWALRGLPFVYLWSDRPVMHYATIPVYGATNWRAPCWIGLPVQWCGVVYAYALTRLAPHDDRLPWKQLARGILLAAEQMQPTEGPFVGCLPDAFALDAQEPGPPYINPCSLVSLRLVLEGRLDSLAMAADDRHRVVAPFPVELVDGAAHVHAVPGVSYQVLVDGARVLNIQSAGIDTIPLD